MRYRSVVGEEDEGVPDDLGMPGVRAASRCCAYDKQGRAGRIATLMSTIRPARVAVGTLAHG